MEEQYKKITEIIHDLAAKNPFITKEQIAKAKSMYNGDTRSIDVIRRELEAYSEQIRAQGLKAEADKKLTADMKEEKQPQPTPNFPPLRGTIPPEETEPQFAPEPQQPEEEEILEPLRATLPNEEQQRQLQSMIDDALGGTAEELENDNTYSSGTQPTKEPEKVFVKVQPSAPPTSDNEGGYGNVTALLSLTIIFSIVTIIMAFFTIISR